MSNIWKIYGNLITALHAISQRLLDKVAKQFWINTGKITLQ